LTTPEIRDIINIEKRKGGFTPMAKKEKKVELRDVLRKEIAVLLMEAKGLTEIGRTKEGLVVTEGEQDLVIRVIQKKDKVEKKDIVEVITLDEAEAEGEDEGETEDEAEGDSEDEAQ